MKKADKILTLFDETYVKGVQGEFGYTDVFINPTLQELESLGDNVRFIVNIKGKKVYVWNAYKELHDIMAKRLDIDRDPFPDIWGEAKRRGNKWFMVQSNILDRSIPDMIKIVLENDLKWAEKYIYNIEAFIKKLLKRKEDSINKLRAMLK